MLNLRLRPKPSENWSLWQLIDIQEYIEKKSIPEPNTGCWLWLGALDLWGGYGKTGRKIKGRRAHRVSFEAFKGPIPLGEEVCHSCDTPPCVNPEHLFAGPHAINMADMAKKGRATKGINVPRGERHHKAKLTVEGVRAILFWLAKGESRADLAASFGVDKTTIGLIARGKIWKSVPRGV